jgi:hypothetical protein
MGTNPNLAANENINMVDNTISITSTILPQHPAINHHRRSDTATMPISRAETSATQVTPSQETRSRSVSCSPGASNDISKCDIVSNPLKEGDVPTTWTVYCGSCMVFPNARPNNAFIADFKMEIRFQDDSRDLEGRIHFRAEGLPPRVHALDELDHPFLVGDICVVSTLGPVPEASYHLQLKSLEKTKLFADCFQGLQQSMALHNEKKRSVNGHSKSPESAPPSVSARQPTHGTNGGNGCRNKEGTSSDSKKDSGLSMATEEGHREPLIDIDDGEEPDLQQKSETDIQNATEELIGVVDKMAGALAVTGTVPNYFATVTTTVERVLSEKYPNLKGTERAKITGHLRNIMTAIIGAKQGATLGTWTTTSIPMSMREFERPITYSPNSLKKLRGHGIIRQSAAWSSAAESGTSAQTDPELEAYIWFTKGKSGYSNAKAFINKPPGPPTERSPVVSPPPPSAEGLAASMHAS